MPPQPFLRFSIYFPPAPFAARLKRNHRTRKSAHLPGGVPAQQPEVRADHQRGGVPAEGGGARGGVDRTDGDGPGGVLAGLCSDPELTPTENLLGREERTGESRGDGSGDERPSRRIRSYARSVGTAPIWRRCGFPSYAGRSRWQAIRRCAPRASNTSRSGGSAAKEFVVASSPCRGTGADLRPRFAASLLRARLTRICRIARVAAAMKYARPRAFTRLGSIRLR
jgi:hypothetical protein